MKVTIKHIKSGIEKDKYEMFNNFIKYLQKKYPLTEDLTICFLGDRKGSMTTGSRKPNFIKVLSKNRMIRDILRTLSHEWVHEYQFTKLNRNMGPDIGGKNEDDANSESGKVIKQFERDHPDFEDSMYE